MVRVGWGVSRGWRTAAACEDVKLATKPPRQRQSAASLPRATPVRQANWGGGSVAVEQGTCLWINAKRREGVETRGRELSFSCSYPAGSSEQCSRGLAGSRGRSARDRSEQKHTPKVARPLSGSALSLLCALNRRGRLIPPPPPPQFVRELGLRRAGEHGVLRWRGQLCRQLCPHRRPRRTNSSDFPPQPNHWRDNAAASARTPCSPSSAGPDQRENWGGGR